MKSSDRRSVIGAIGAMAALPAIGFPTSLLAQERAVAFPEGPLVLRRKLVRELGQGAAITVTRDWRCQFAAHANGARVSAEQIASEVTAPPPLAALASTERDREVTGLFPMELGRNGLIADWPEAEAYGLATALRQASEQLDQTKLSEQDRADAARYLARMGQTAAALVSRVPRDLFFPEAGQRSQARDMPLSNGVVGRYEVSVAAKARSEGGLLAESERRIVTRVGEISRTSVERWSILS